MSSDVVELTSIKDEDLLRHMWQQTEDFGRKKDIRAHMYKLREERLRNFYTGDMDAGIGITKSPMTTSHGDSLTDQSFQSFKTKEIRDSESPTRGYKFDVIAPNTSEWNVVTSSEVTPDGKTHKSHTLATTGAAQNIPGGKQTFSGKNEQLSSDTFEGDDKNFRASSGQSSDTVLKEHVVTGDENSGRIESKTSKTTSSSSFMSTQYQSDGNTPVTVSGAIDHNYDNSKFTNIKDSSTASTNLKNERENLNNINQKCYSTTNQEFMSKQEEQQQKQHNNIQNIKTNSNSSSVDSRTVQRENELLSSATTGGTLMSRKIEYPDANTKVITETKSLPDGSIITSTKYETRSSAAKNWATSSSSSNKQSSSTSSSQQFINEATSQQQKQQHIVDDQHRTTKRINNNNDNNEYRTTSNNTTTNINRNDQERKLYDEEIIRRDMERDMKRHEQLRRNEYGNVDETTNTTNNKHYYTKDTQKSYETVRNNEILHRDNIHATEKQFQNNTTKNQQDVTDRIQRIDDSNVRVHRIDDNTVRHHKIDDNNVRIHRIDDNNVQTHKIDDNTVRHHRIDDKNVTVHRIDDNNVKVHRIDDNNIRVHKIDNTVRHHKIDDNNIRVHKIDDDNVRHKDVYVEKFYEIDDHNNKRRDTFLDNHDVEKVYTESEQHRNIRKNIDQSNRAENIEETYKTERRDNVHRDELNRTTVQDKNVHQQKYQYENVPDEMYTQETHKIVKKDLNRNANYDNFTNKRDTEPITPTQYNQRPIEHIVTKDDHFSDNVHKEYVTKDSKLSETRVSTESFNKEHFISKRISVDHNPTHEAFARSLRCISPADSSRSLRSSNKSLPRSRTGSDRGRRSPSRDTIISDSSKISSNTITKNRTDVTKDYRRPTVSSPEKRTPYSTTPNQRKQTTNVEYSKTKDKIKKTVSSETIDIINDQTTTTNIRKPSIPEESIKTSKYKQPSLSPTRPNKPLSSQESPNRKSPEKTKPSENLNNTTSTRATTKRDETNINYNTYDETSPDKKQPDTRTTPTKPFDRTKDEIDYVKNKPHSKRFTEDISITYSPTSKNNEDGKDRSPRKQSGPRNEPNYMKDTQSSKIRTTDDLSEDELCITNDYKTIKENHTTNYVKDINEMSNKHVTATNITTNDYKKVLAKTLDRHHQVPNGQYEDTKTNYDITTKKTTEPNYMKDTKSSKNYHSRTQKDIITTSDDESIYFSDTMTKSIHEKFDTKEPREKYSKSPSPDKISKQIDNDKYRIVKDTEIRSQSKPRDEPSYMKDTQASKRFSNRTQKDITTSDDDTNYYCDDTTIKLTEEKSIINDYDIPTRKYSKSPSPSRYIKRDDENTLTYLKDTEIVSQKKPRDEPSYMKDTQASKRFSTRTQKDITTSEDDSTYYGDTKATEHSKSSSPNRIPKRNDVDDTTSTKDTEFVSHTKPRDEPNYMKNTESSKHLFNRTTDSQQTHKTIDKSYYNEDNIETFTDDIDKETVNSRRPKSSITDNKTNYQQPTEIFKQSVTTPEKTDKSVNNVYENVRPQKPAQYPVHNDDKPSKTLANKPHGENIPRQYHEAPTKTGSGDQRPKTTRASPQSPTRKSPERFIKDTHKTDVRTTKTRNYRNQNNIKNQSDDDDEYDDVQERESPRSSSPTSTVSDLEYLNVTDYNKHNKVQLNVDENIEITTKQNDYEEITSKKPFYLKEQNTTEKIVENTTDDINDIKKRPTYSRSETYEDRCRKILGMNTTTTDETVTTTQNDVNKKLISSEQTVVTDYNQRKTSPQRTQTSPIKDTEINKPTTHKDVPNSPIRKQSSPSRQSSPDEPKTVHKITVDKSRAETPTSDTTRKSLTSDTKLYQNLTTDQTTLKKSTDISSIYTKRTSSVSPTRPTTTVTTTTTTTTNKRPSIIENDDSTKKTDKFINEFVEVDNVPKTRKATHADIIDFIKSEKQIFITPSTKPKERTPSKSPDRKSMPENKRKISPDELAPTSKSTQDNTAPIANKPINRNSTTSPTIPTDNIMTTNKTLRKQSSDIVVERKISHDNFDKLKPKPQSKTIEIITTDKTNKTKNEGTHFTKIDHESLKTTTKKSPSKGPMSQTPEHSPVSRKSILNDTISTISKPCYTETVTTKLTTITPQKIDKSTSDTKYVSSSKIHISPVKSTTPIIKTSITTKPVNKTTTTTAEVRKQKQNIVVKDQQKTKSSKIIKKNHMINEQHSDNESDVESYGYSEDDAPTVIETKTTQITATNRKIPVTERKDSAPVYRTTKIDKDVKMSRSTSDAIIKTNKGHTTSTTQHTTVRKPSKPDVEITKNVSSKITKTPTKTDTTKRPTKCITTKTINLTTTTTDAINSENMENIIIDIQQAKSSREPSPNRIVPIPVSPDEDTGKPRYPDTVHEPDDDTLKRKPKIKNIPIFEEETNSYIGCEISEVTENERTTKFTHLSDIGKVTDSDECMLSVSDKVTKFSNVNQQNTNINRIKEQSNKLIEQTDFDEIDEHLKTDECLLSVHDKVSKFITTAEEVKKPKSSSQLKSPVTRINAQTIDTNVNEKITKYRHDYTTTAANNVTTTQQHDIPYKNRTHPNYNEVDIDEELREDECLLSVSDKVNKFITTAEKLTAAAPQKSPELVAKIERQVSRKDKFSESEPDDAPLANKRNVTPKTSITDRYIPQKDTINDIKPKTPVTSYRTETIQKAKAVFETNPGSTPTPKQRNILSRPSIWEDRRQRETTSKKDVKLTDIGVYKRSDENDDEEYEEDEQEVEELFYEKTNKIITEKNNPKENLTQKTTRTPTTPLRKETVTSKRNLFETISTSKTESDKKFDRKSLQVKQQPLSTEPESEEIEEKYYSKITKHTERQPNADNRTTTTKITKKPSEISNKSIDIKSIDIKSEIQRKTPIHSTTQSVREPISPHRSTFERPSDAKPLLNEPKQSVPLSEDRSKPSYMNHTVSSIEHIRRDSIEINKNHLKKSSTHDDDSLDDDNNISYINESPKTAVKFGVELKRTNSQQSQDRRRKSSSSELTQIEEIYDILLLEKMLETVVGYEQRRRIRSQIRLVRKELGEEVIAKKTYICTDDSEQSDDQKVQRTKVTQHFGGVPRKSEKLLTNNITPTPKRTTTFDESSIITTGESEYTSSYSRKTQNNERVDEIDSNKTPIGIRTTSTRNEYRTPRSPSPKSSGKTITTTKEYITPRSPSPGKITTTTSTKQYITARSPSPKSSEKIISTTTKEYRTSRSPSPKLAAKTVTTTTTTTTTRTKESGTKPITTITTKKTIQRGDNDVKDDKPIWATKNILKKASETQRKSYKMNNQSSTTKKNQEKLKTTDRTEDCVISSYGIGPTDENGKPLFGIRALKKKTQPVETSKVAGVIIKETLYSENGSEPIGKRTITQYSSDPNDVVIMDGHINNEITTEEFNASNYKYNNKLNQKGIRNTITDTFGDDYVNDVEDRIMSDGSSSVKRSTRVVRRGSVKELSEKFIQKESQYEHEQPSSTNTSTYTTKTTTSSNTYPKNRYTSRSQMESSRASTPGSTSIRSESVDFDECDVEIRKPQTTSTHKRTVIESVGNDDGLKYTTTTTTTSSSAAAANKQRRQEQTRSFTNSNTKITGVQDCLNRMSNADNIEEMGDTEEDKEARALLNKFLGASVLMTGVETMAPTEITHIIGAPSVKQKTIVKNQRNVK